tara:strand:- start:609 stop:1067 length:459 start_codon:yes stop_codon:yes gene_type:complete
MPKGRVAKSKMFRDFSYINDKFIKDNYLKLWHPVMRDMSTNYDVNESQVRFMLFVYDLEFWTRDWIAEQYGNKKWGTSKTIIYPLLKNGYLYKHFNRYAPNNEKNDHLFREELGENYRIRYALSQKGRIFVARFYNKMQGGVKINAPSSREI